MADFDLVKIGDVAEYRREFIEISDTEEYKRCRVQLHKKGVVLRDIIKGRDIKTKKQRLCKTNDFIVAEMDAKFGGYGIIPESLNNAIVSSHYYLFELNQNKILPDYLKVLIDTDVIQSQIKAKGTTNYSRVSPKEILNFKIPCPSIDVQKKIIKKYINSKKHVINILKEFDTQQSLLKKLRQAILQEAIEGKLTAEWRKKRMADLAKKTGKNLRELRELCENDPDYSAKALLEKIKAEKEKLAKSTKGTKKFKELPPVSDDEKPFDLPEGWVWCRLGEIINKFSTGPFGTMLHKSDYVQNGIPLVNPTNIIMNKIVANPKMMVNQTTKNRLSRYILDVNDIVLARRGDFSKCAVVSENEKGWLCGTGSFFIKISDFINKDFFIYGFISNYFQKELLGNSIGQTMNNLNQSVLKNALFAIPPLAEQQAIVEKVDRLMAKIDALEKQVKERKAQAEQLMQAVLREAFNGEE